MRIVLLSLSLLCALTFCTTAQQVRVQLSADSTAFRLGEWIPVELTVMAPENWTLIMPESSSGIEGAELVSRDEGRTYGSSEARALRQRYTISVFDTGAVPVTFVVRYRMPGDTSTFVVRSNALLVRIAGVAIDTNASHKDLDEIRTVGYAWWEILLFLLVVAALLHLAIFLIRFFRAHRRLSVPSHVPAPSPAPQLPAHVVALEKLHELESMDLVGKGEDKVFQTLLANIVREYVEARFEVPALEHPTSETISALSVHIEDRAALHSLSRLLTIADMTKFARFIPTREQHQEGLRLAYRFVDATRVDRIQVGGGQE